MCGFRPAHHATPRYLKANLQANYELEKYTPIHEAYLYLFLSLLLYQYSYFLFLLMLGALLLWLGLGMLCHK
ncbi:hypothetical protein KSD_48860 [Ktedonobacter sp. SOSP1-85]|nr:hypothetical protein KSD_48860 [Ktedonobacter sp. SOSP1-85]